MSKSDIQRWIAYWTKAKMVAFDNIQAFEQVHQARKFCECMRTGIFAEVTDLQIWNALQEMRKGSHNG